ncbi:MAG TPA: cytochrome b N-terminal domain-containing protein [Terriglobales bacterium]|nr:cytochrome b N-terminal domain-containing protein [Terriglobales bacterium]
MPPTPHDSQGQVRTFFHWLDHRTGIDKLMRLALHEPIPGGARWAYVFGSGLLFLFMSQVITGVFLAFYYVPSADHAHTTVAYIAKEVNAGALIRSIHAYGSSAIVIVLIMHVFQTFFFGAYKGKRELLWVAGCVLFALMLGMSFTGYLLPWDQKAYFATTVGTNIISEVPLIGDFLKRLLRGGTEMGTLTLSRFFVFHVFLLPASIFAALTAHVYLFRKAGPAGPYIEDPLEPKLPSEPFYPKQIVMDLIFAIALLTGLAILGNIHPMDLGPRANPAETQYLPRPEWYYLPAFQWLKYWQGPTAVIGIMIIPALLGAMFVGLPFYDKSKTRHPLKRPISISAFAAVFLGVVFLGMRSHWDDNRDPTIAKQMVRQNEEVGKFMALKFEPELAGASLLSANIALANPMANKGKEIFEAQACSSCHGDGGIGTPAGPSLIAIHKKYDHAKILDLLKNPNAAMKAGGMEKVQLTEPEYEALIAHMESLK